MNLGESPTTSKQLYLAASQAPYRTGVGANELTYNEIYHLLNEFDPQINKYTDQISKPNSYLYQSN